MNLGDLIKDRREALGLTLEDVADRASLSRSAIHSIERGHTVMPREADDRRRLCRVLGIRHWEMVVAAGIIDADELPGGTGAAAPVSEVDDLMRRLSDRGRAAMMTVLRDYVASVERAQSFSEESDPVGLRPGR
jgi:transcriptional regulator with XRE-family HTH domain